MAVSKATGQRVIAEQDNPDVNDDELEVDDDELEETDDTGVEDIGLKKFLASQEAGGGDDDDDDDDDEADEDGDEGESGDDDGDGEEDDEGEEPEADPKLRPGEKLFTQEEVNRIIGSARIKGRETEKYVSELQALTGMPMDKAVEYIRQQMVTQRADELGITEEEANMQIEKDKRFASIELEMQQLKEENHAKERTAAYEKERAKHAKDPVVRKYMAEIDAFSENGMRVDFEPAMFFIIGQKFKSGELKKSVAKGAENKALANISKQKKKGKPESGSQSGGSGDDGVSLTKDQRRMAKDMGLDPKEVAMSAAEIDKERRKAKRS